MRSGNVPEPACASDDALLLSELCCDSVTITNYQQAGRALLRLQLCAIFDIVWSTSDVSTVETVEQADDES